VAWDISLGISPCFPLAGGFCKFYANAGGKRPKQRRPLLVRYKHQNNPHLSMHNYIPLVISANDKDKQLTLLSQHKLAFNREKYTFCVIKSLDNLTNVKMAPSSI
jgi:hypothetical protein